MGNSRKLPWLLLAAGLLLVLLAWKPAGRKTGRPERPERTGRVRVVATIPPLADFARQVGGERVSVTLLLPPGATPHTFDPTPRQAAGLAEARLFVEVGAGLEFWADRLVRAAGQPGLKRVVLAEGLPLVRETHHHGAGETEGASETGEVGNPHLWLDPVLAGRMVARLADALVEIDPDGFAYYRQREAAYQAELKKLDAEIAAAIGRFRTRAYVTFHPAWTYFGRRYGLAEAGVIEAAAGREPTPAQLEAIVRSVKKYGIRAVFAEPQFSPRIAEAVAENTGSRLLFLDPLGDPGDPERDTYLELMRYNLKVMKTGLE